MKSYLTPILKLEKQIKKLKKGFLKEIQEYECFLKEKYPDYNIKIVEDYTESGYIFGNAIIEIVTPVKQGWPFEKNITFAFKLDGEMKFSTEGMSGNYIRRGKEGIKDLMVQWIRFTFLERKTVPRN